jgi:GntR family transcriptional regulator
MGIREQLDREGLESSTKLIAAREVKASEHIAAKLMIEEGTVIYDIVRLRSVKDQPFSVHRSFIPRDICPKLLENEGKFETSQLCDILRDKYGIEQKAWSRCLRYQRQGRKTRSFWA